MNAKTTIPIQVSDMDNDTEVKYSIQAHNKCPYHGINTSIDISTDTWVEYSTHIPIQQHWYQLYMYVYNTFVKFGLLLHYFVELLT